MWIEIISMFAISLALTLIIELVVAKCWGFQTKKELLLVILVNILTNPAAVFLSWICNGNFLSQCVIEFFVVVVEAKVYWGFTKVNGWHIKKPVLFALIVNMVSWMSGLLIQYVI